MSEFLFNEFDEVSAKEWKQKIQVDLKGTDYNETLIWNTLEGIDVKPFYHSEENITNTTIPPNFPKHWNICQEIFVEDATIANKLIKDALSRGAESIKIKADKEFDLNIVFSNVELNGISIYIQYNFLLEDFIVKTHNYISDLNAKVYFKIDIIGNLAKSGNWYHNLKEDHLLLENIINKVNINSILQVDTSIYQNAGATMVQQLAYALAHANEYFNHFNKHQDQTNSSNFITFTVAVGSNYFFEISKLRALRKLYSLLAKEYNIPNSCHIFCVPSKRNKTLYDYNVNLLRTTTEYMSAVLGGADTVGSLAYDSIYHKSNEFGERIARNQLLILKEESYFNTLNSPADGSYYIESITNQLAEKALELFKNIEANGGFLQQLKEGTIQRKIKENAEKEQILFDKDEIKLLGTNLHPNPKDRMKNDLELYPFVKIQTRKTLIEPIIEKRLSEKLEINRLKKEE